MENSRVYAVVVTYHPHPSLLDNMERLRRQLTEILIVDNGSVGESAKVLEALKSKPGITLIRNEKNLGIATALNMGIRRGIEKGYEWVATFDQDSTITPEFFSQLLAAYEGCPFKSRVAIVAPVLCISEQAAEALRSEEQKDRFSVTRTAMSSGSLIRMDVFQNEGPYDQDFFMDYVDYDYCLRLHQRGWKIIRARKAVLVHRLGAAETHSFLGHPVTIKSHTPWRRYHIMRNRMVIYRRYALSSPLWCLYDFAWIFLEMTKIVLFEREKGSKFRHMIRGLADGLVGRMGQLGERSGARTTA